MSVSAQGNDIAIQMICREEGVIESLLGATSVILRLVQDNVAILQKTCTDGVTVEKYTADFANGIVVADISSAESAALPVGVYHLDIIAIVGGRQSTWEVDAFTPNTLRIKAAVQTS